MREDRRGGARGRVAAYLKNRQYMTTAWSPGLGGADRLFPRRLTAAGFRHRRGVLRVGATAYIGMNVSCGANVALRGSRAHRPSPMSA